MVKLKYSKKKEMLDNIFKGILFTLVLFMAFLFTPSPKFEVEPIQTSNAPNRTGALEVNEKLLEAEIINTRKNLMKKKTLFFPISLTFGRNPGRRRFCI